MAISGFLEVSDISESNNKGKTKRVWKYPAPVPVVSQETRDRLYAEAIAHPNFEGMSLAKIQKHIDDWVTSFLADKPYWYGHTGGPEGADVPHHVLQKKYQARREKAQHDREIGRAQVIPVEGGSSQDTENAEEKGGRGARQTGEQMSTAALLHSETKEQGI